MVSPSIHKQQVVFSNRNSSQKIQLKESCTKWSFWVKNPVLVWLAVEVALLDGLVALGHKELVPLKVQVPLTF